ncbi:MAG: inositol monophosphatase [Anaerolineales bacterium]|nr:inositol monophosphatase [Anaerolineales bacterium]
MMTAPTLPEVEQLARQSGEILRAGYKNEHQIDYKGVIDLVTEIDHQSEEFLIRTIAEQYPGHSILAEESGATDGYDDHRWFIDPLDGTVNYAHGIPIFSVSIAYARAGQLILGVVYDPMRDECFSAELGKGALLNGSPIRVSEANDLQRSLLVTGFPYDMWDLPVNNLVYFGHFARCTQGVRRLGSAAIDLCYVACGRFDGYWELSLQPWDLAAGGLIAREAGARVTNIRGEEDFMASPPSILASTPGIHAAMKKEIDTLKNAQ